MTCGSGSERYGRHFHHFPELPCDLNKDSWCASAGSQYPWGAVRRFVYENQGLMKRMYGNQRHYNVLRTELLNELYDDMFDEMPKRQHHRQGSHNPPPTSRSARYRKPSSSRNVNSQRAKPDTKTRAESRAMKVTIEPEYSSVRRHHSPPTRPKSHAKPQRKSATASKTRSSLAGNSQSTRHSSTTTTTTTRLSTPTDKTTTTAGDLQLTTTEDVQTTTTSFWGEGLEDPGSAYPTGQYTVEEDTQATLLPPEYLDEEDSWTTLTDPSSTDPSSSYSTPYSSYETESSYSSFTATETSSPPPTTRSDLVMEDLEGEIDDGYFSEGFISTPLDKDDLTTLTLGDRLEDGAADYTKDEIDLGIEEALGEDKDIVGGVGEGTGEGGTGGSLVGSANLKVETREQVGDDLRVEGNVAEEAKIKTTTEATQIKRPIRGMNACPVKEEFVAPYWANNTRGETLALLNLYPFEQYVQWERCKYEHRQMYCRRGCRCEQQYRLHKLLAFDPTNECRGIFSDWFRFPSCCVCKCYDLPMDVFTTSPRRPRVDQHDEDDYFYYEDDEEEEEELDLEEEEEEDVEEEEEEEEEVFQEQLYQPRSRPGSPLANIPPQRRPRPPPRPYSHISPPSHTLVPPSPAAYLSQQLPRTTESPEVSTLGTVDAATPHYYYNLTNFARIVLAKGQPLGLSRLPRSPGA